MGLNPMDLFVRPILPLTYVEGSIFNLFVCPPRRWVPLVLSRSCLVRSCLGPVRVRPVALGVGGGVRLVRPVAEGQGISPD